MDANRVFAKVDLLLLTRSVVLRCFRHSVGNQFAEYLHGSIHFFRRCRGKGKPHGVGLGLLDVKVLAWHERDLLPNGLRQQFGRIDTCG